MNDNGRSHCKTFLLERKKSLLSRLKYRGEEGNQRIEEVLAPPDREREKIAREDRSGPFENRQRELWNLW